MRRGFLARKKTKDRAAKHGENWLKTTTESPSPDIFYNKHLLGKAEEKSTQPWDKKMWFLVILGVWIPTQVLEEMGTHRHPMGAGCCATFLTLLCWIIFVGPFEITPIPSGCAGCQFREPASSWHFSQPCSWDSDASHTIPTSSHCSHGPITLLMGACICTTSYTTFGTSQLRSSCHTCKSLCGKSLSFHGKTEGQMVAKPKSQQCLQYVFAVEYYMMWKSLYYHEVPNIPNMTAESNVC